MTLPDGRIDKWLPLIIFFAHVCAWIYDTEESDHTAQYICSATATGNEWKKATKMFCLKSRRYFLVHKYFDHILSASLKFNYGITLVHTQFIFLVQTFHQNIFYTKSCSNVLLSQISFIFLRWWSDDQKVKDNKYWLLYCCWWCNRFASLLQKQWVLKLSNRQYKVKSL